MVLFRSTVTVLALLLSVGSFADGDFGGPKAGQIYLAPGLGYMESPDDLNLESEAVGASGVIGFPLTDRLIAELLVGQYDFDYQLPGGASGGDNANTLWINGLYKFTQARGPWQPFALVGLGRTGFDYDGETDAVDVTQGNVGVGVFGALTPRWSLRTDVRGVYSEEGSGFAPYLFMGLSAILGPVDTRAPTDTDGDGVADRRDACPNTPAGSKVDARGCPLADKDTDGDGVSDRRDACPNTRADVAVDRRGCAVDADGDGVPNYRDECPNSEAGALVDRKGCYVVLEEDVTIDMSIEFDTNSADIRPSELSEIRAAVKFLRQFPAAKAVIEGHTDDAGAASYNQALSERRARSVYQYLTEQAGIPASRLSYVGHGEARPVSGNDTAEGRQRNRRVSAVLSATREVRKTR